jgi:hypothetical protein
MPAVLLKRKVEPAVHESVIRALVASGKLDPGVAADQQSQLSASQTPTISPYVDDTRGFSIQFPPDWTITQPLYDQSIAIKALKRGRDNRLAALNIYVHELEDPNGFSALSPQQLFEQTYGDQATLLSSGRETLGSSKAIWIEIRIPSISSRAVGYAVPRGTQVFWLYGNTVLGEDEWFQENRNELLRAIRSFRFLTEEAAK